MKCLFCKVPLVKKQVDYSEYGISLGRFPAFVCPHCGEYFFDTPTAKKIQQKSKEKGLFGLSKRVKIGKIGDSLMVRIPKDIAHLLKLKAGKEVFVHPAGNKIIIEH